MTEEQKQETTDIDIDMPEPRIASKVSFAQRGGKTIEGFVQGYVGDGSSNVRAIIATTDDKFMSVNIEFLKVIDYM